MYKRDGTCTPPPFHEKYKQFDKGLSAAVVTVIILLAGVIVAILVYWLGRGVTSETSTGVESATSSMLTEMENASISGGGGSGGSGGGIDPTRAAGGLFVPGTNELATIDGHQATWAYLMETYPDAFINDGKTIKQGLPTTLEGELVVPIGVTSIEYEAFASCFGLTSVTIPSGVTSIGAYTFSGCEGLTSVTIPSGVKSIGNGTFRDCTGLTSITIPDSVKSINSFAFLRCTGLTSITIPDSVKSIGDYAFMTCTALTKINFNGTKEQWNAMPKGQDWNYVVPATCKVVCTDGEIPI